LSDNTLIHMADQAAPSSDIDPVLSQTSDLVHLHNHSEFSSLDGGSQISKMPAKLKSLGMKAMALTDHGVMQGLPEFYEALRAEGIKPILGMEAYLTNDRFDKTRGTPTWHLTLLAETTEGYHNLCKISSWAFIDGVILTFGRPRARADWKLLRQYSKGIIAFTGCMAAPVMSAIFEGNLTQARYYTEQLIDIFGKDNVYGEIQNVGITIGIPGDSELALKLGKTPLTEAEASAWEEVEVGQVPLSQTEANRALADICTELGLRLVATGDTHYLNEDDADPHDAMLCIGTGQLKKGPRRFSLLPKKYHMRSDEEMLAALAEWPEAITNTKEVAQRCNAEIVWHKELLPRFPIPDTFDNSGDYLRHLCQEGLQERYENGPFWEEAQERLAMELGVIGSMGFNDYFLIVWDLFNEARKRDIPYGPGRGSAAGAITAYCLGITQLCPLENKLLFERFLNPDRKSMPDIDMDFAQKPGMGGREELIEYAREKYNTLADKETAVAQIVTFQKYKPKGAIRDAARVLADPGEDGRKIALQAGDKLASYVPDDPKITMERAYKEAPEIQRAFKGEGFTKEVITLAAWLEGFVKTYSLHAAAVLIASHDLSDDLPLQRFGNEQPLHVQYDMTISERIGLLKMDFLGLRNLDIIWEACKKINATHGVEIKPYSLAIDDAKTYELFARGDTVGTFQFESTGMQNALKEVGPTEFNDLVALVALYRPGPMAWIPVYADRKKGREAISYADPRLEEIQGETYGITIYQEQSMLIARSLADFTPGQADDLRKAIGKKIYEKMMALKKPFMEGCQRNGVSKEIAETLWKDNESAADYSFNKAHAACYGYLAYITGYLKANYPHEYMAALLSSVMGKKDKPRMYLTEAKRMGLPVLPPDINRSLIDFSVMEREDAPGEYDILFPLRMRGVGGAVVSAIREERQTNGPFVSIFDVIRRMPNLNRATLQALVKGGALDVTGASRMAMFETIEDSLKRIKKEIADKEKAFVKTIKTRYEIERAEQVAPAKVKLSVDEKKAIEGAAKAAWALQAVPEPELLVAAIVEALTKEQLRVARAEGRASVQDRVDTAAGINAEERGDENLREMVERQAQAVITRQAPATRQEAKTLMAGIVDHLSAEFAEREAMADLNAAISEESDPTLPVDEWPELEKLNYERGVLEIYVSGHPLESAAGKWKYYVNKGKGRELSDISDKDIGETVRVVGALVSKTQFPMRSGDFMYRVQLEDLSGSKDIAVFPRTLEGGLEALLEIGQVVCMEVGVQEDTFRRAQDAEPEAEDAADEDSEKAVKLTASRLYRWDPDRIGQEAQQDTVAPINIEISSEHFNKTWVDRLRAVCSEHPGNHPVRLILDGKGHRTDLRVQPTPELATAVQDLLRDIVDVVS
jgi:DNA polymerase-3 subunit alpha